MIIATLVLATFAGCKSKTVVAEQDAPPGQVTLVLAKGATPESIVKPVPFEVISKNAIDKKNNEWRVLYDLKNYNGNDLRAYLINLADVISLDGIVKDVTPPIRGVKEKIPTKVK